MRLLVRMLVGTPVPSLILTTLSTIYIISFFENVNKLNSLIPKKKTATDQPIAIFFGASIAGHSKRNQRRGTINFLVLTVTTASARSIKLL